MDLPKQQSPQNYHLTSEMPKTKISHETYSGPVTEADNVYS